VLRPQVPDWEIVAPEAIKRLRRAFAFDDFAQALAATKVGRLAKEEGHHPLLLTEWGRTTVISWMHKIKRHGRHQPPATAPDGRTDPPTLTDA
jgi:4a-hydroxytetrahydrobiopterin dehydratase